VNCAKALGRPVRIQPLDNMDAAAASVGTATAGGSLSRPAL
jgi:hypothetical protein